MLDRGIDFCFFSGTGNTLLVVRAMANVFRCYGLDVSLRRMEVSDPRAARAERALGLGFPVAIQTTYRLVWDFVRALPTTRGTPVFMVDTMGGFSGGVVGPMRQVLEQKGYQPIGAREIIMPLNVFIRVGEAHAEAIRTRGLTRARRYAEDLLAGRAHWGHVPILPDLLYAIVGSRWLWDLVAATAHRFDVDTERCTRCGVCVELCPLHNIVLVPYPRSLGRCQECLRCLSFCPTDAIRAPWYAKARYRAVEARELLQPESEA